ncbi:MAG: hypothetical protein WDO69_08650 [Pseudomonadota bacterium]
MHEPLQHRAQRVLQRSYHALMHVTQSERIRDDAIEQFRGRFTTLEGTPARVHAWSPLVADLVVELSAAFAALRILQNEVWGLAAAAAGATSFPPSVHDACNKLRASTAKGTKRATWITPIPPEVRKLFTAYWAQDGERLANYRNVDQHFDVLARQCFLDCAASDFSRLWVYLPDNPENKSPKEFTYNCGTDGITFARKSFDELYALIDSISRQHVNEDAPLSRTIQFHPPIVHELGVRRTTALLLLDHDGREALRVGHAEDQTVSISRLP